MSSKMAQLWYMDLFKNQSLENKKICFFFCNSKDQFLEYRLNQEVIRGY